MRLTFLGTGNAAGMPVYGCICPVCLSAKNNSQKKRTPCSALLESDGMRFLIDAGQVNLHERFPAGSIDGIILTHFHPDHVQGLLHLRWGVNLSIPVYTPPDAEGCADLYKHPGILHFRPLSAFDRFMLAGISITPLPLAHSKPTFGYLFEKHGQRIAYLTDTKGLPKETETLLRAQALDSMVIDCSYAPGVDKKGHNNLDDVLQIAEVIQPKQTVLTHIGHDFDVWLHSHRDDLPSGFVVGSDAMVCFDPDHVR